MTSRKRLRQLFTGKAPQNDANTSSLGHSSLESSPGETSSRSRESRRTAGRDKKRRHLLETLESRQMFAGPQLIGIQPNEGELIENDTILNVAPRSLTFRFDEVQQIDPATFAGIQISRAGADGTPGTPDDVRITPGLVTLGDIRQNEVVVRFAENLPDDRYQISVSAFDDPALGIVALRNINGEAFVPKVPGSRSETTEFFLDLGALVEAIVPQPVVRLADGTLEQRRDEILVYFNEDKLYVEDDPITLQPTRRSAENPRFYQLLLTQETVSTRDDAFFSPTRVIYDKPTNTARLIFSDDLNVLAGSSGTGGTFRLRVGAAVDNQTDLVFEPTRTIINTAGDTLTTSADVGTFNSPRSILVKEAAITPKPFAIQFPGSPTDPGRLNIPDGVGGPLAQVINDDFGPDANDGITEIPYNFEVGFAGGPGTGIPTQLNNITNVQKQRIREALDLWARYLGIQFRETANSGITFAVGDVNVLTEVLSDPNDPTSEPLQPQTFPQLNARLRVDPDPTFGDAAIVFSSQSSFGTAYGQDFFRKAMAGIGFLLGLEQASDLTSNSVMSLDSIFLNESIDPTSFLAPAPSFLPVQTSRQQTINDAIDSQAIDNPVPNALNGSEPSFPGNYDILHGRLLYRPDGNDVDLYRFTVDLTSPNTTGELNVETFAERLADASLLNTSLTLFKEQNASALSDFGVGTSLAVRFDSVQAGPIGNNARIDFIQSTRAAGDTAIRITRVIGADGQAVANAIRVDIPRKATNQSVPVSALIDAINNDAFASTLFRASLAFGSLTTDISRTEGGYAPVVLGGGGLVQLSRNDDYFSQDSLLQAELANGVYYIGVSASGNDSYDPTLSNSGTGGTTQGNYELQIKFSPRISEVDSIRDRDEEVSGERSGVPGTAIDGDGDGTPGGVKNFWFQTRPLERMIEITGNGASITAGQTLTITGANGVTRRFEFVDSSIGQTPAPGNIAINFTPTTTLNSSLIALAIVTEINRARVDTGVSATRVGNFVTLVGERAIQLSGNFSGATVHGRTIFVDKSGSVVADGTKERPFNTIANPAVPNAFAATFPNDIVRIVGNGGQDGVLSTAADNFSYQIGVPETGGTVLPDGRNMEVPKGVTVMIDAGAAFKLRNATISVGSSNLQVDRSGGAIQILGTPRLVSLTDPAAGSTGVALVLGSNGAPVSGSVTFTSTRDRAVDSAASGNSPAAAPGNWGGLIFRRDVDASQGRRDLEDEGIFLQLVNHADIRFGGGSNIFVDANQVTVNPIQLVDLRPTITFNRLTANASAAISASPDSFEETSFQAPRFQQAQSFTPDYGRVGPDINNNLLTNNSINGILIRTETAVGQPSRQLTGAGRFDDIDIVHYIAENIVVAGTPGGTIQDGEIPDFVNVSTITQQGGGLAAGAYSYRMTFVDANGFESLASAASTPRTVTNGQAIQLVNLPAIRSGLDYVSRRLYRSVPGQTEFRLAAELPASGSTFVDNGRFTGAAFVAPTGKRGRLNASLVVDPGTVVKFRGARIELGQGTQLLAEGTTQRPVIFTSALDDRYGGGGSFDTNNDRNTPGGGAAAQRGDWSGIYAGPNSNVSLDNAVVAYGGGVSLIEGGQSRGFLALELHQADARVANSRFEFNDYGLDGSGPVGRNGRLAITPATIFVRGSEPTIVNNQFVDNYGSIIDIDLGSMSAELNRDLGRQTGALDRFTSFDDNYGPLIRLNTTSSPAGDVEGLRQMNGLRIRGGQLTAESIWDDTDIAHVLFDSVTVGNQISGGALTLKSRGDESLVIKMLGEGTPNSPTLGTGFTATGSASDIADRIGGTIHVLGLPGAPVVFTSYKDDSIGAGRRLDGRAQTDTNGDGIGSRPSPNDWRSLHFDGFSNDRNVGVVQELELPNALAPGLNGSFNNAQVLGDLAERLTASDDSLRLGFEVRGYLSEAKDIDTYSFSGVSGTVVWIDVDKTTFSLDTVIELLDPNGVVVARSINSFDEFGNPSLIFSTLTSSVGPLADQGEYANVWDSGLYADFGSTNPRDAGLRVALPGTAGIRNNYFVRVRSASTNPADASGGRTNGAYSFQIRLREEQEFPGSVVQFADIRFANHGIHLQSLPGSSPLLGEAQENESAAINPTASTFTISGGTSVGPVRYPTNIYANNDILNGGLDFPVPVTGVQNRPLNARPQYIGNIAESKNGTISVGGSLSAGSDIDFYQIDVEYDTTLGGLQRSTVFDIDYADGFDRPDTNLSIFYSPTGRSADARLVLFGQNSNILDDQASPLNTIDIGELLSRGSVRTGDSFVGPVSLPQGSYFVAVTESGRLPQELTANPLVRREPLDSLIRIFEDHIDSIGGSTALQPREGSFVATTSPGWTVTTDRAQDLGHQLTTSFNGSKVATAFPPSIQFESEFNNSFITADDLNGVVFSRAFDPNIGSATANTSTTISHTTVNATTPGEVVDVYRFTVNNEGSLVILDVDNGFNPQSTTDFTSVDLKMQLFREVGDPITGAITRQLVSTSNFAPTTSGAGGSLGGLVAGVGGSTALSADPFIQLTLPAGVYYVAVSPEATVYDPATQTFSIDVDDAPAFGTYNLHVSIENEPFAGGDPGNQSYFFDRSADTGALTSSSFDLTGYAASDLPRFYFDYFYNPGLGDSVELTVRSDQQPTATTLNLAFQPPAAGDIWRQGVVELGQYAGNTGIVIEFNYTTNLANPAGEGLYLDNFVVGFAERGEMITGASVGAGTFNAAAGGVAGQYQLEVRRGTEYTSQVQGGIDLTRTFDTNDRHAQQLTLVAPEGAAIVNGDRFVLSDGNRDLTFEFNTSTNVAAGNIRIPFSATDTAQMIARQMIDAINSGTVQTLLELKASTSSGVWDFSANQNLPTDARVALHGSARGEFLPVATIPAPGTALTRNGDGTIRLAAIFDDGTGDQNTLRTQGQVVVANNVVSDARAIGIWSDVGFRGTDPEDDRSPEVSANGKVHLRLPPVGNSQLGAAINLPTLNNSVVGGLASGVTIVNNVVDQAGFAGVKVDGETRPFVIEWNGNPANYASGTTLLQSRGDILVPDGFMFAIDAGGTRVVFEFEEMNGAPTNLGGSGVVGGDGFVDGHVPIYYRLGRGSERYNPVGPGDTNRNIGFTAHELMMAIHEAIQGSILVTNGLVELVRPTIGPSVTSPVGPRFVSDGTDLIPPNAFNSANVLDFPNPAVYLEGVSGIYSSIAFQKAPFSAQLNIIGTSFDPTTGQTAIPPMPLAPVYESPQPLARIINNTIYGADGTEASVLSDGSLSRAIEFPTTDSGETIGNAVDTKQGRAHRGAYIAQGRLGDNSSELSADQDVDFYKVELSVGDRLVVDIDTLAGGPSSAIRLFDSRGIQQAIGLAGEVDDYIKPGTSIEFPRAAQNNNRDRFLDFTATSTGTYYVGISSQGNETYDPLSFAGRTAGLAVGNGNYTLGIEVLAPRSFVFSFDSQRLTPFGAEVTTGTDNGTDTTGGVGTRSIIGTTFTISQIPDYLVPTRAGDAYRNVQPDGNRVTFEFTDGVNAIVLPNGNINVPVLQGAASADLNTHRVPDIMRAISNAINGYLNNPALPNHENGNGPDGASGPVSRVKARALGGSQVDNTGIENLVRLEGPTLAFPLGTGVDFTGFGHDRREGGSLNLVPDGTFTDSRGTTELFTLIENAAKIELSPEARAAGLKLGPDNTRLASGAPRLPGFATESDQLLTEFGILVSSGASAAVLNNLVSNAHQSIVKDETSVFGFGGRIDTLNPDRTVKPAQVVLTGNAIEFDDERNTQIRSQLSWWIGNGINVINRNPVLDTSLSTDLRTGPSNISGGNSDFNFVVRPEGTPGQSPGNFIAFVGSSLLENPAGNRFTPVQNAPAVDSAVDSILENTALAALKASVGIPSGLIVAPNRDVSGQLRADDPLSAPPGGLGSNVFKDRGAVERADFVGPVAILDAPRDNDAEGVDSDPAVSVVQLNGGVYQEFRILLQDLGDSSDPFVGTGIDDDTVVVPVIPGLRESGAALALFEGDRLLTEGIDYTFSYDTTKNLITLRPLAGVWRSDRAYRISINNRDRIVGVAPAAGQVADGDSFAVIDDQGGRVTFEYDSGYQLRVPETLAFTVAEAGTGTGGIADGDRFSITGTDGISVVFEFNRDGTKLPSTREVRFNLTDTPAMIAASARAAIAAADAAGVIDVDVDVTAPGPTVVIGSNAGTVLDTSGSGLINTVRTLALRVPTAGTGATGVADGDVLIINDGSTTVSFEFETENGLNNPSNTAIPIANQNGEGVLAAILLAIDNSALRLAPTAIGNNLFLGLPANGFATVSRGNLTPVGISRTPAEGDTITFTPAVGAPVTLELTTDAAITAGNVRVDFTRSTTGDQLAAAIANAIQSQSISGLNAQGVQANPGGLISVGGTAGLGLALNPTSSIILTGAPDVTGPTVLSIFGPLLLQIPVVGGSGIPDDSQFTLTDGVNTVTFIYNVNLTGVANINATPITYQTFEDSATLAAATVAAINASILNINAVNLGNGQISLGAIADNQLSFPQAPATPAPIAPRRGIVTDGDQVTITQGGETRVFEFELAVGGGGVSGPSVIPVVFQSSNTIDQVASILAAAINNNRGPLNITATALPSGQVRLADTPQTVVTISNPTTITVSGEPGGAIPIAFTGSFSAADIKRSTIDAINNGNTIFIVGTPGQLFDASSVNGSIQIEFDPNFISGAEGNTITLSQRGRSVTFEYDTDGIFDQNNFAISVDGSGTVTREMIAQAFVDAVNESPLRPDDVVVPDSLVGNVSVPGNVVLLVTDRFTSLTAEDRGGATYFIENAVFVDGPLPNYFLEGVKDLAGQLLEPTRDDNTTQFTLLLPTIGLDYGDAPDPRNNVPGRYPTRLEFDGPRHIDNEQVKLGTLFDIDTDGLPNDAANGDDTTIFIIGTPSEFFDASVENGFVEIAFLTPPSIPTADGSTITLSTGVRTVTYELDTNGIFNENNFAISLDSLRLQIPVVGGNGIPDDSQFTLTDGTNSVTFVYNINLTGVANINATPITYQTFENANTIAIATAAAINASGLNITATVLANGEISLGFIADDQYIEGVPVPPGPAPVPPVNVIPAPLSPRRGIVDGSQMISREMIAEAFISAVQDSGLEPADFIVAASTRVSSTDALPIAVSGSTGNFFRSKVQNGIVTVGFNPGSNVAAYDGESITLVKGNASVTFEFDTDGSVRANNKAIFVNPSNIVSLSSEDLQEFIANAFANALSTSALNQVQSVVVRETILVVTDDEDGVTFGGEFNPDGVLNRGIPLPITVTVTGGGILEAWIDFNFDGDFTDPGEQIINRFTPGAVFSANATGTPVERSFVINVPATAPIPAGATTTYARFRVSAEGGLAPTGLALSGEVEDYQLTILSGLPPTVNQTNNVLNYTVDEDGILQARDADGTLTPGSANDDGALAVIRDPDGDEVAVFADDIGTRTLLSPSGDNAGTLTLFGDGTFTFVPTADFFGKTQFTFRVTDLKPSAPNTQLVSPVAMTVNLTIDPVNDRPFVSGASPVINRTIAEDSVLTFTAAELTGFYSPGPANESNQPLLVQSAGVNGFGFQTLLGGTLTLVNGSLQYTPPANFPGPGPDRFTYVVADNPNDVNQLVQTAQTLGTVVINITNVNDPPITGTDTYAGEEDTPLTIPISGPTGILANDSAGPPDEINAGQTISLVQNSFPMRTARGGEVKFDPSTMALVYTPPANFSGQDQFTYQIVDTGTPAQTASGTVLINVGGDNDAPVFVGINGDPNRRSLTFDESKETEQVFTYNLSSWFIDPEGDFSTFTVTSSDPTLLRAEVLQVNATGFTTLRLTLPPRFVTSPFVDLTLNVLASNVGGPSTAANIPVRVNNTPDPPTVIGSLNPINANEDAVIVRDLSTVFNDPDGSQLTYRITRLGTLVNPTPAQIAASPLMESITFSGNTMTIRLERDAFGTTDIEIAASDSTFEVRDSFSLIVASVPDAPRDPQGTDFYNVPIGARFEIIDPAIGLVGDDVDPDGGVFPGTNERIRIDSFTQPSKGTVQVNPNGTFVYINTSGNTGETDSFTYRPVDPTGLVGDIVTVTLNLGRSRYQNPIPEFNTDVTADGVVSPIDALRVINRIAAFRRSNPPSTPFSVSTITTAPPDFIDVNGDGLVTPLDALLVINKISRQNRDRLQGANGEGEMAALLSSTVAYAAQSSVGLPESNHVASQLSATTVSGESESYDPFAAGFDVIDRRVVDSSEELIQLNIESDSQENGASAIDEVLSDWSDSINL